MTLSATAPSGFLGPPRSRASRIAAEHAWLPENAAATVSARRRAQERADADYARPHVVPDGGPHATRLVPEVHRSGLFQAASRALVGRTANDPRPHREHLTGAVFGTGAGRIQYDGPRLDQGHASVFLWVVNQARGATPVDPVRFRATEACRPTR